MALTEQEHTWLGELYSRFHGPEDAQWELDERIERIDEYLTGIGKLPELLKRIPEANQSAAIDLDALAEAVADKLAERLRS